jgi:hypothetical protein
MGVQEWNESGKGEGVGSLDLEDLYMLAIRGGFVFTTDENVPAKKRANLQSECVLFVCEEYVLMNVMLFCVD